MKTLQRLTMAVLAAACLAAGAAQAAPVPPPPYAWVVHPSDTDGESSIVKLDARTGAQIATIPIPAANGHVDENFIDIVASPDGRWVAIAGRGIDPTQNADSGNIDVILVNTATDALTLVERPISHDGDPIASVAWAVDSSVLYGLRTDMSPSKTFLVTIDPDAPDPTLGETNNPFLSLVFNFFQIYPGADGRHAVLTTHFGENPDWLLNLVTLDVREIDSPDANSPSDVVPEFAAAPDGRFYYTYVDSDSGAAFFTRFTPGTDAASDQFDRLPLDTPCTGQAVAVSPDGRRAYVTNGDCTGNPGLLVFDLTNFTRLPSIDLPGRTTAVDVGPTGETVLALMPGLSQMAAIDLATGTVQTHALTDALGDPFTGLRSLIGRGIMIGGGPEITALVVNPANPQFVYSGTNGRGMYVSSDGGQTWHAANTGLTGQNIVALAATSDGAAVYAATHSGGVFKSVDNGGHWQPMNAGLPTQIRSLAISPNNNQVIYVGIANGKGVYRSTDGGATWQPMNDGLPN